MVEINSSVENPELLRAITAFQREPARKTEEQLAAALHEAQFLLPVQHAADGEGGSVNIDLPALSTKDGQTLVFAFTDWKALEKWSGRPPETVPTIQLSFSEVAGIVLQSGRVYGGFAINPGGVGQHLIPTRAVASYSGIAMPVLLAEQTEMILGEPYEFPEALGKAVCEAVGPLWPVKRLWLLLKKERGSEERSFLILVEHLGGDLHQICDTIGHAASAQLPPGVAVELLPAESQLARAALEQHPQLRPFFERPRIGGLV